MSVVTQGTQLFVLANGVVSEIECITAFSPGGSPADQIDDTCLSERNTRKYKKGLRTPGQATATLNADPANASHLMLSNMAESNDQSDVTFAIGWADGESGNSERSILWSHFATCSGFIAAATNTGEKAPKSQTAGELCYAVRFWNCITSAMALLAQEVSRLWQP